MENKKLIYGILVVVLVTGVGLSLALTRQITIQSINSFEECTKASYPIFLTHPRRCRTPDGRNFVEQVITEVCRNDAECKEGFYCKKGLCIEFSPDLSCSQDLNCQLINMSLGFACCWAGVCERIDYSQDKWIAVNQQWFRKQRQINCPAEEDCGPAPMCEPISINEAFKAQCIDRICQKVSEEETKKTKEYYGSSTFGSCSRDNDCFVSGCNSEICQSKGQEPLSSICVVPDKPLPVQLGLECKCSNLKCQWTK